MVTIMPSGVIVGWPSNLPVPSGWAEFTSANGRYLEVGAPVGQSGEAGGHYHPVSCEHSHHHLVYPSQPTSEGQGAFGLFHDPGSTLQLPTHPHTHGATFSSPVPTTSLSHYFVSFSSQASVEPYYYTIRLIRSLGTAPIPVNAYVFGLLASPPAGYEEVVAPQYYLRASSQTGVTGGTGTSHSHGGHHNHSVPAHDHIVPGIGIQQSSSALPIRRGSEGALSAPGGGSHSHPYVRTSSASHQGSSVGYTLWESSADPQFYAVALWRKTAAVEREPRGIGVLSTVSLPAPTWEPVPAADGRLLRIGTPGTTGGSAWHSHLITPTTHSYSISPGADVHGTLVAVPPGGGTEYVALSGQGTVVNVNTGDHSHTVPHDDKLWSTYVSDSLYVVVSSAGIAIARYRLLFYQLSEAERYSAASGNSSTTSSAFAKGLRQVYAEGLSQCTAQAVLGNFRLAVAHGLASALASVWGWGRPVIYGSISGLAETYGNVRRRREAPRRTTTRRL